MNGEIAGCIEAGETQAMVQSRLKGRIAADLTSAPTQTRQRISGVRGMRRWVSVPVRAFRGAHRRQGSGVPEPVNEPWVEGFQRLQGEIAPHLCRVCGVEVSTVDGESWSDSNGFTVCAFGASHHTVDVS